jgi:hypothetical protein
MVRALTHTSILVLAVLFVGYGSGCDKSSAAGAASSSHGWTEAPDYPQKVQKITHLLKAAPTSQPSSKDVAELFDQALHDPDFRIRVRAMAVFPYLHEREKAIDVLITCVQDRNPATTGDGNVPLYATTYLVDMRATRAIPAVSSPWFYASRGLKEQ